jgi:hypothetical protein
MVFVPTDRLIVLLARPDVTADPFTVIDAPTFEAVGVTVTLDTPSGTLAVYDVVAEVNTGDNDPELNARFVKSASDGDAAVYVMVTSAAPAVELADAAVKAQEPET